MRFPSYLGGDGVVDYVSFQSYDIETGSPGSAIYLHMPVGITSNDGASFGELQLGAAGDGRGGIRNDVKGEDGNVNSAIAQTVINKAAESFGAGQVADISMYAQGQVLNPNTVLKYDGPALRDFSFTFNMVPRDAGESSTIANIHNTFRRLMYADAGGGMMGYPAKWKIKFMSGNGENTFLPKISECYLTALSVTANPTGNIFHADGAPNEVNLTVSFRETFMLTRATLPV